MKMSKDKTLATFQIDKTKWSKFKRSTGNQSASAVLVEFIEKFLDNPHILEKSDYDEATNIEHQSITDSRIKALEDRLSVIEEYNRESAIDSVREYISNLETRYKKLESKLSIIESSNHQSVTNSDRKHINNLESECPSAITENINKKEQEKIKERDKKVSEALKQAESEGKVIKKQIYQRAAELLNEWNVLDKSGNQGQWSWTKVRDYFKK